MSDTPIISNDIEAAIAAGQSSATPQEIHEHADAPVYSFVIPAQGRQEIVDTEPWAATPRRAHSVYRPATHEALSAVIKRFQETPDATTIWIHPDNGRIIAIFNDNGAQGSPAWRDHRAELQLKRTDEWTHWLGQDGKLLSQVEFAEHVEDGITELVSPPGADMLELAQSIQATQGATFRSAIRLQDGSIQTQYDEEVTASAGKSGQMTIPSEFTLAVAPFVGESPYQLTARLRYRLSSGHLRIGYKIERPEAVIRDALSGIGAKLAVEFQAATVVLGEPF